MADFKQGDIVRYAGGETALARLDTRHALGWHAVHCLGGYLYVSETGYRGMRAATEAEIKTFNEVRANTLRLQGRTEKLS